MSFQRLRCKPGVFLNPLHLRPEFHQSIVVMVATAPETVDGLIWITSLNDGRHRRDSKHYEDAAWDLRCWNIRANGEPASWPWQDRPESRIIADRWAGDMAEQLSDFDILVEEHWILIGQEETRKRILVPHIHGELDPKGV